MKIPVEEQYKFVKLSLPDGSKAEGHDVLLHACCAPCSSAIVECMLRNGMKPTVYFSNSNIYPLQEFEIRKHELMRFLEAQGVPYVEDEYDHEEWLATIKGLELEPERGSRCSMCFLIDFLYLSLFLHSVESRSFFVFIKCRLCLYQGTAHVGFVFFLDIFHCF